MSFRFRLHRTHTPGGGTQAVAAAVAVLALAAGPVRAQLPVLDTLRVDCLQGGPLACLGAGLYHGCGNGSAVSVADPETRTDVPLRTFPSPVRSLAVRQDTLWVLLEDPLRLLPCDAVTGADLAPATTLNPQVEAWDLAFDPAGRLWLSYADTTGSNRPALALLDRTTGTVGPGTVLHETDPVTGGIAWAGDTLVAFSSVATYRYDRSLTYLGSTLGWRSPIQPAWPWLTWDGSALWGSGLGGLPDGTFSGFLVRFGLQPVSVRPVSWGSVKLGSALPR